MAKIIERASINYDVVLALSEQEAKALLAITSYGTEYFLKMFYDHFGRDKLKPYEQGLNELFKSVRDIIPDINERVFEARKIFNKER
jgi:protein-tyrosine-phosphatase